MRLLVVVHGFPPATYGGAELYAHAHASGFARQYGDQVFVLTRERVANAPEFRVRDEKRGDLSVRWINNTFRAVCRFEDTYDNSTIRALAAQYIDSVRPDVAHVHHLTCLSTTILDELARRRIPVVLTLHDYWLLCHRGQLLNLDLERCGGPAPDGCGRCTGPASGGTIVHAGARLVREAERHLPRDIGNWIRSVTMRVTPVRDDETRMRALSLKRLRHVQNRWAAVSIALAPSNHVRERFIANGFPAESIRVSEYGVDPEPLRGLARTRGGPLRLGFLGSLMVSKAPHLLVEAAATLPAGAVTVELFGQPVPYHGDDSYVRQLALMERTPGVTFHGPVSHEDVPRTLASIDVLVFPSVWEETSGIGARESLLAGVPVVASRLGGIPETVTDEVNGLLFEPGSAADLARQLRRLLFEPQLLARLRTGARSTRSIRTLEDDVRATRELCLQLIQGTASARPTRGSSDGIKRVTAIVLNYGTPDEALMTVRSLLASDRPFDDVIVVDNGDGDDVAKVLAPLLDRVTLIPTGANLGFSGGVNAGIQEARRRGPSHVMLVNSDVILAPDAVRTLLQALRDHPDTGIAAPVVLARSRPGTIATAGMAFAAATGRMRHPEAGKPFDASLMPTWKEVDGVSGCAMLIADEVFDRIGLLSEKYFFSFEDLAFCLSARDAGFGVGVCGAAVAYHEGSRTLGAASPRRLYFGTRNQLLLSAERPACGIVHRAARAGAIVALNVLYALRTSGGSIGGRLAAVARGAQDHIRGRYGPD